MITSAPTTTTTTSSFPTNAQILSAAERAATTLADEDPVLWLSPAGLTQLGVSRARDLWVADGLIGVRAPFEHGDPEDQAMLARHRVRKGALRWQHYTGRPAVFTGYEFEGAVEAVADAAVRARRHSEWIAFTRDGLRELADIDFTTLGDAVVGEVIVVPLKDLPRTWPDAVAEAYRRIIECLLASPEEPAELRPAA